MKFKKGRAIVALIIIITAVSIGLINAKAVNEKTITFEDENLYIQVRDFLGSKVKRYDNDKKSLVVNVEEVTNIHIYKGAIKSIAGIEQFQYLTSLDINNSQATGDNFESNGIEVKSACKLENLDRLNQLMNLKELSLSYCQINNNDIGLIAELKGLEKLQLSNNEISDVSKIAELGNLQHLVIDGNNIEDINSFNKLDKITYLNIENNNISDLSALAGMKNLTYLYFSYNKVNDISVLSNFTKLSSLKFQQNQVYDISVLSNLRYLKEVQMSENHIGDFTPLLELPELKINDTYVPVIGKQTIDINVKNGDVISLPKLVKQAFELFDVAEAIDCINCRASDDYKSCIIDDGVEAARIRVSKGSMRDSIITLKVGNDTDSQYKLSETQKIQVREGKKNEQAIIAVPKAVFIVITILAVSIWIVSIVIVCKKK